MRQFVRLETAHRYYVMHVMHDLLGDVVVVRNWGGKSNQRGGGRQDVLPSLDHARKLVRTILSRRRAHGYICVAGGITLPTAHQN